MSIMKHLLNECIQRNILTISWIQIVAIKLFIVNYLKKTPCNYFATLQAIFNGKFECQM